jgi:type III secretion inner rod protein HrpB2
MTDPVSNVTLKAALEQLSQGPASPAQTSTQLADKFQAMMQRAPMVPPAQETVTAGGDGTAIALKLVAAQDAELQHAVSDTINLMNAAPYMSMNQMNAESIRMSLELASMQLDMGAKMGVVNSSKSAIETLMKNQ